jgi:hypothetical protein
MYNNKKSSLIAVRLPNELKAQLLAYIESVAKLGCKLTTTDVIKAALQKFLV